MEALKKGFLILIVGFAIVFLSFFPWDMFLPPWQRWQYSDWTINSGAEGFFQGELLWGATIQGQIWCGGGNNDINFFITDSGGNVCLNPGKIYNGYRFKWRVPHNDIYSFKFGNSFSESSNVGYLISSYYYMHVLLIIGAILVAIGLYLILKEVTKRAIARSERKPEQPSPLLVEEETKVLIEGLQKETEDLKSAVRDLQATIVELLERAREPKSD